LFSPLAIASAPPSTFWNPSLYYDNGETFREFSRRFQQAWAFSLPSRLRDSVERFSLSYLFSPDTFFSCLRKKMLGPHATLPQFIPPSSKSSRSSRHSQKTVYASSRPPFFFFQYFLSVITRPPRFRSPYPRLPPPRTSTPLMRDIFFGLSVKFCPFCAYLFNSRAV